MVRSATVDWLISCWAGPAFFPMAIRITLRLRQKYWGVYAQDDFQMAKNLSVHVGVRWEPSLPEHDIYGRGVNFSLARFIAGQKSSVFTNAPPGLLFYGDQGIPPALTNGSYLDFAPRVGAAWDPRGDGKQSVRVSYGIFFDTPESYTDGDFATSSPWGSSARSDGSGRGLRQPVPGHTGRKSLSFAQPAPGERDVQPGGNLYHLAPESAPYVHAAVESEFGAAIGR